MTYHDLYRYGLETFDFDQEALLLLNELCRKEGIELYSVMDEEAEPKIENAYKDGLERLKNHEPLAYILSSQPFYGYDFYVDERVLIPRPETEELCELVLRLGDEYFGDEVLTVFDVGTGSGAIAITLSLEDERYDVFASDLSREAVDVAKYNNKLLGGHVIFLQGDLLAPFIDRNMHCDILVCNPPYIPKEQAIEESVKDFEPHLALFGGEDGLDCYRKVFRDAHEVLNDKFLCCFEIGYDQKAAIVKLAKEFFPEAEIEVHKDLSGKDRMLSIYQDRKEDIH